MPPKPSHQSTTGSPRDIKKHEQGKLLIAHGAMVNVLVQLLMLIKTAMIRLSGLIYLLSFQALSGQFST